MAVFTHGGKTIESQMEYREVVEILNTLQSGFASSLASQYQNWLNTPEAARRFPQPWSAAQMYWAYKLAEDNKAKPVAAPEATPAVQPQTSTKLELDTPNIWGMLTAPTKLKRPEIRFQVVGGMVIFKSHRNLPNVKIVVWDDGRYTRKVFAYIRDGRMTLDTTAPAALQATIEEFEENPTVFVAEYGKKSGQCCFCRLPLTDKRSLSAGYGPICAGHYNLPWG